MPGLGGGGGAAESVCGPRNEINQSQIVVKSIAENPFTRPELTIFRTWNRRLGTPALLSVHSALLAPVLF